MHIINKRILNTIQNILPFEYSALRQHSDAFKVAVYCDARTKHVSQCKMKSFWFKLGDNFSYMFRPVMAIFGEKT
jgi:hypothetical protein